VAYRGQSELAFCPRCVGATLEPLARGHVRIFACKTCSGVFLEPGALEALARGDPDLSALADDAARPPPRPADARPEVACPHCGATMTRIPIPDAKCEIDLCRVHGAWFDRWEAQSVARAVADPGAAKPFLHLVGRE
jgi:Zn-finger nucleic acid-binding protein